MSRRDVGPVALVSILALVVVGLVIRSGGDESPPPAALRRGTVGSVPPTTATTTAPTSGGGAGTDKLSPAQARAVDEVKAQISSIRGLAWTADLPIRVLSKADLGARVKELIDQDRVEHADDIAVAETSLKLLGLLPPRLDYIGTINELLSGTVLGFYDDKTKELVVGGDPSQSLSVTTRAVLAHELTHALTDQHFDFGTRSRALDDADRTEESFALVALIEGDAEHTADLWATAHLSEAERAERARGEGTDPAQAQALARAPRYLLNSLYFPYEQGLAFVRGLYEAGGFAAVDSAYAHPPTSTENILHPATYSAAAGSVAPPPALAELTAVPGCEGLRKGTLGEFDMTQLLDLHLSEASAKRAATGWNGDTFALVHCGSARGLIDRWTTDTALDLDELVTALDRWSSDWSGGRAGFDSDGRFSGPDGTGRVIRGDGYLDLVLADDQITVDRLVGATRSPTP